jgi:phosphate starvation-inducible PhoH-like protein
MLEKEEVSKIILSRPAVEAGEKLGFLPGDLKDKVDPYLRPLYDALEDVLSFKKIEKYMEIGVIEIAPLAFMRGRTLSNAYIILDEAQNTSKMQMKMFLTRLGFNSRMVITGDITQIDLPNNVSSGLSEALKVTNFITEKVTQIYFNDKDVVRHPLVQKIVNAYERIEKSVEKPR